MNTQPNGLYLFSIDLEDAREGVTDGFRYQDRVSEMTHRYLAFLKEVDARCTFFTVGSVAQRHPSLIREIVSEGHEIGCHTDTHVPLDRQTPESFREDLKRNIDHLMEAGAHSCAGFRAPTFSLTEKTKWAYEVLEELGFTYSSSVLPAAHKLYGWEGFGEEERKIGSIHEIPVTLLPYQALRVPAGGGVYFRVFPAWFLTRWFAACRAQQKTITGYFHPYDIDTEQERYMHSGIKDSKLYNALMYMGRGSVLPKLRKIISMGFEIMTYREYVERKNNAL